MPITWFSNLTSTLIFYYGGDAVKKNENNAYLFPKYPLADMDRVWMMGLEGEHITFEHDSVQLLELYTLVPGYKITTKEANRVNSQNKRKNHLDYTLVELDQAFPKQR